MKYFLKSQKSLFAIGRVLLFCLCCAIGLAFTSALTEKIQGIWAQISSISLAAVLALLLSLIFMRWQKFKANNIGLLPGRYTISHLLVGILIGCGMVTIQFLTILMSGHLKVVRSLHTGAEVIGFNLLLYLMVACREEIAFRGYPLRNLDQAVGQLTAQFIVGTIFISEHILGGMNWFEAIIGSGLGAWLFGLAALKSRGIALPVGIHAAWNFGQWALGLKNGNGIYKVVIGEDYQAKVEAFGWLGFILAMGTPIAVCYFRATWMVLKKRDCVKK